MNEITTIRIDGACRPNPGHGACAFVLERPGHDPIEAALDLGENSTCNIAEYKAILHALDLAEKLNCRQLIVYSDSKLLVNQMNNHWRVLEPSLVPLHHRASRLRQAFDSVRILWIPREQNTRADALCKNLLDNSETTNSSEGQLRRPSNEIETYDPAPL